MLNRALIGVVDFLRIVSAPAQSEDFFVGHVFHQLQQLGIFAEEFFSDVGAVLGFEALILAVQSLTHALDQKAAGIASEQWVPIAAPENFDDVPAGASEGSFQLGDDLAVAADGTIQALQVAVNDKDEVVQFFARGERDGSERLGFVGLAVAEEGPDFSASARNDPAILEIPHEAGL